MCTSTLAQGVNLPIRYLIISSLYQAQEKIKVRDFHNLIGRAGLYTEGTILLSESFVYSRKGVSKEKWRWRGYLEMLDSDNSESCLSQFLLLVRPESFGISYDTTISYDFYKLALARYNHTERFEEAVVTLVKQFEDSYPSKIFAFKMAINRLNRSLDAIESYLLSFLNDDNEQNLGLLVSNTFGYFLASEEEKERMNTIFTAIRNYILDTVSNTVILSKRFITLSSITLPIRWAVYSLFPVPEKYKIIDYPLRVRYAVHSYKLD